MHSHKMDHYKILTSLLAAILGFSGLSIQAYEDVDLQDPAYEAIEYCKEHEILSGYEDGLFHGEDELSRGMLATILWRIFDSPESGTEGYSDVEEDAYFYMPSKWALENGLMSGNLHSDGSRTFDGADPIRRQDLSLVFYRLALDYFDEDWEGAPFVSRLRKEASDYQTISSYALEAMEWSYENTLFDLIGQNALPTDAATRSVSAVMIQRYFEPRNILDPVEPELPQQDPGEIPDENQEIMDPQTGPDEEPAEDEQPSETEQPDEPEPEKLVENLIEVEPVQIDEDPWPEITELYVPKIVNTIYNRGQGLYYANNVLLIYFDPAATWSQKAMAIASVNGRLGGRNEAAGLYQVLTGLGDQAQLENIAAKLMARFDFIKYATYDSAISDGGAGLPDDPWNGDVDEEDWKNNVVGGSNYWAEAIEAQKAWILMEDANQEVVVGVFDTSIDPDHEDLEGIVDFVDENARLRNETIQQRYPAGHMSYLHGTGVSGLIGAIHNNGVGIAGTAPDARIVFSPFEGDPALDERDDLFWDSRLYDSLSKMVMQQIRTINVSIGKSSYVNAVSNAVLSAMQLRDASMAAAFIDTMLDQGMERFMIVQSAGNGDSALNGTRAAYGGWFDALDGSAGIAKLNHEAQISEHVMMAGAVGIKDGNFYRVSYSNFSMADNFIYAPGQNCYTTYPVESFKTGYSDVENGTSFSAPIVSGVIGMMWAVNPDLCAAQIQQILKESATTGIDVKNAASNDRMVNAANAVRMAMNQ